MREHARSFRVQQHRAVLGTTGAVVAVNEPAAACSICGGRMEVQKTFEHKGATLEHGVFRAVETVYVCASRCRKAGGEHAIHRAPSLAARIPHRHTIGYDVMVFVGLERYVHYRQRDEIRAALEAQHGIQLSTGEISDLGRRFLAYLERLHYARADRLRAALEADGGWPLNVDATGEQGRGTLLVAYTSWRRWVLGAWKIPTERSDAILPRLRALIKVFGAPCAAVRDLGKAVIEALDALVKEFKLTIRILACHRHFLADIGEDLLDKSHSELRLLVRRFKIRNGLAALARNLGRGLGSDLAQAREGVRAWQAHLEQGHELPEGSVGVACVRAMAQWVLDFAADGRDQGFPFDRPYLNLCERGWRVRRAVDAFRRRPSASRPVTKALRRLARILDPLMQQREFELAARTLRMRATYFDQLRDALRLTPKPTGRNVATTEAVPVQKAVAELQDIRKAVLRLKAKLKKTRPERGPAEDERKAIDIILRHLDDHGRTLWGHVIRLPATAAEPGALRVVDRTNNSEEGLFHGIKHNERRRSGRKTLTKDLEDMPAAAALAVNLRYPDYVELVCGRLSDLPAAFAELDRAQANELARPEGPAAHIDDTVSASLLPVDRKLIREAALAERILAAARSRAPATAADAR